MMKTSNIILLTFLAGVLFSCDKVKNPIIPKIDYNDLVEQYYPGDPSEYNLDPEFPENTNTQRNVLIEDYTGHTCNNCPPAATTAKNLEILHSGKAFVLSVHAGGATNSFQRVSVDYPLDFTTEAGTTYSIEVPFDPNEVYDGFFGNPQGLISRKDFGGNIWLFSSSWGSATQAIIDENNLIVDIQLITNFYEETGGVFVHYEIEAKQDINEALSVIVILAEKKVISPQKMPDGTKKDDYEHHNVLSGNLNGTWGESIGKITNGQKITGFTVNGLKEMNTKRTINADGGNDLMVFALVVNSATNEVYQVVTQDLEF